MYCHACDSLCFHFVSGYLKKRITFYKIESNVTYLFCIYFKYVLYLL